MRKLTEHDINESACRKTGRTMPTCTLLQGMPYVHSTQTDIRKRFDEVREAQVKPTNVKPMRKAAK